MKNENCKLTRWFFLKQKLNNLSPEDFQDHMEKEKDAIIIDVRKPEEYAEFHFPNSINYNYLGPDFWEQIETLDPEKTYLVYCRSERRSLRACTLMQNSGFKHVFNLDGGINAWKTVFDPITQ